MSSEISHAWLHHSFIPTVHKSAKKVVHQIRESGGAVNISVVIGIITGILRDTDSNLLAENDGPISVGKEIAHWLLGRMQFVKEEGHQNQSSTFRL